MITFEKAREIAAREISRLNPDYVIVEESTIEKPYGWVFFWATKDFIETRDYRDVPLGNAPIIVNRNDATYKFAGTSRPIDEYLHEYEREIGYRV
jgi:hypothetical protein